MNSPMTAKARGTRMYIREHRFAPIDLSSGTLKDSNADDARCACSERGLHHAEHHHGLWHDAVAWSTEAFGSVPQEMVEFKPEPAAESPRSFSLEQDTAADGWFGWLGVFAPRTEVECLPEAAPEIRPATGYAKFSRRARNMPGM